MSVVNITFSNEKRKAQLKVPIYVASNDEDVYQLVLDTGGTYRLLSSEGYIQDDGPWNSIEEFLEKNHYYSIVDVDINVKRR